MALSNVLLEIYENREEVINLFLDIYFWHEAPFSIVNLIEVGISVCKKNVGEWYGAHSIT